MRSLACIIIFILLSCISSFSQNSKPITAPAAAWVSVNKIDYQNTSLDKEAENGSIDLDYEEQVNLNDQSMYIKHSNKILSEAGVQDNSQISIYFDPTFQKLVINSIEILRNGSPINKLNLAKIKVVHVETDLNRFIYNGQLEANLILDDVRKGDIVQYSYTLKGFNPVFQNRFEDVLNTKLGIPVYDLYYKLIVPANRSINIKNYNDDITPVISNDISNRIYEWHRLNNHAIHVQDHLPDWYDPYSSIRISEFNSWTEVSNWAALLFPKNVSLPMLLKEKINNINTANKTPEEKVAAALRFVEDDIRYMGVEMGIHSHKPASPGKVFSQRFGDCKEKSYLLSSMLNAMNINACPVLINTSYKKAITGWLPAATDFDHCTVLAVVNKKQYWLDPTITYQRGSLFAISYPDYQYGLTVTDTTTGLSAIQPQGKSMETVKETFAIPQYSGLTRLKVVTAYSGLYADNVRSDFNSSSNYNIQKNYLDFYKDYFDNIASDSLTYADNDSTGIFTTTEYYSIDSFWTMKYSKKSVELSGYIIEGLLRKPKETDRTMPVGLSFPSHYKEELDINLAGTGWNLKNVNEQIHNAWFTYTANSIVYDNRIVIDYDFERLRDNVIPADTNAYFADLKKVNESEGYQLNWDNNKVDEPVTSSKPETINVVLVLLVLIGLSIAWTQKRRK